MKLGVCMSAGAAIVVLGGPATAHHSYAAFDRSTAVTVQGMVEQVEWTNPHVVIVVRTADGQDYRIEWSATQRLRRAGLPENPFAIGDEIALTGSAHRDPEMRILTLITKVERPADGWSWRRGRRGGTGDSPGVVDASADP